MKSNQERSNECLPPKKREIPATSRPSSEDKAVPSDNHRAENAAWLPGARGHVGGYTEAEIADFPKYPLSSSFPS